MVRPLLWRGSNNTGTTVERVSLPTASKRDHWKCVAACERIRDRCALKSSHQEDVQKLMFWMLCVWTVLMWKPNLPVGEVDCVCRVARADARAWGSAGYSS